MKTLKKIFFIALMLAVFYQITSLLKCEVLTIQHKHEFSEFIATGNEYDYDHVKILNYYGRYPTTANIYCWSSDTSGNVLSFVYDNDTDTWQQISMDTIWSASGGSASEVIWPYWLHFIYGGL